MLRDQDYPVYMDCRGTAALSSHEQGIARALPARDDGGVTRTTKKLLAAALLALGGLAAASQASAQGFYLGGSIGKSKIDDDIAGPNLITTGTVDGKDSGFKLYGGYQFGQYFGVELAYIDLGTATYSGTFGGSPVTGGKIDIWGLGLFAVGIWPVSSDFSLFGKLGFLSWEAEWRDVTGGTPFSGTDSDSDLAGGLGLSYSFTKNLGARLEWERFKVGGGEDFLGFPNTTRRATVDLLSVGVVYRF